MRIAAVCLLLAGAALLGGCHTAKSVAVTTFRVLDAPAAYVRNRIDSDQPATTTTTTTTTASGSDVVTPGHPVAVSKTTPAPGRRTTSSTTTTNTRRTASSSPSPRPTHGAAGTPQPQHNTAAAPPPQTAQYPTARPVPGKPGFVYSPYDPNGGYVDVTGYASGSKAKDPYSQKIFIVP
jgi:hypothetical protein